MDRGLWLRLWDRDRRALAVMVVGSVIASVGWRGASRPMGDTPSYRAAAELLAHGLPALPDRTPGYPLLLLLTGSTDGGSHHLLFAVQLAMHLVTICLVVDLARGVGIGTNGRAALAVLLSTPPVLLRVVYEGTEALSALLLTLVLWLIAGPGRHGTGETRLPILGLAIACSALVRPTFALLVVPVALLMCRDITRRPVGRRWGALATLVVPSIVIIGGLSVYNGVRFDSAGLTPMTATHLSSRTGPYVENLPRSYEPARSVLIRARDEALLRGESSAPANFIDEARPALERATGMSGAELDRYLLRIDIELIANNPFAYLDTVKTASVNFTNMDSQPAILGLGRPAAWLQQALHLVLLAGSAAVAALVPGLAMAQRVPRRQVRLFVVGLGLSGYTMAVSVMVETGTARLRAPIEPTLALLLVVGTSVVLSTVRERRRATRPSVDANS